MSANQSDVVKTLRSLLNSAQNGLSTNQLMRDYREMEGHPVPFREFGFNSLNDFLIKTNEFELMSTVNGPHVFAKLTKKSAHIAQLVDSQNRTKKKKNARPPPRPIRNTRSTSNWNQTAYSTVR